MTVRASVCLAMKATIGGLPDGSTMFLVRQTALRQREIMKALRWRLPLSSASWMHIVCTRFLFLQGERRFTAHFQLFMQLWPMVSVTLLRQPHMLVLRPTLVASKVFSHWCWSVGHFRPLNVSYRQQLVALRVLVIAGRALPISDAAKIFVMLLSCDRIGGLPWLPLHLFILVVGFLSAEHDAILRVLGPGRCLSRERVCVTI